MTVTTLPTAQATPVAAHHGGALAIRSDQEMWSPQQRAVLAQSGISDDVTNAELAGFLHLCQRTGLDPFSRQIYLIGRKDKAKGRTVFTPQTGIDGYRVIAQRVTSQTGGTYGYEDTLWCDPSGRWRDVWLPSTPPAAAKVTVIRNGQRFSAVATFAEYVQAWPDGNPKGLWGRMPAGQIAKCAEALALRKAFPHDLAGVYTAEEMAQADNPAPEQSAPVVVQQQRQTSPPPPREAPAPQQSADDGLSPQARAMLDAARAITSSEDFANVHSAAVEAGAPREFLTRLHAEAAEKLREFAHPGEPKTGAIADMPRRAMEWTNNPVNIVDEVTDAAGEASWQNEPALQAAAEERAHAEAESALRVAASRAQLNDLDDAFGRVYGLPIAEATVGNLDAFRQQIEQAAGGAR